MIENKYYHDSIALLFKNNTIIGWVPTQNEADKICELYTELEWEPYNEHLEYVDLKKIDCVSYLLTTETLTNMFNKNTDKSTDTKRD